MLSAWLFHNGFASALSNRTSLDVPRGPGLEVRSSNEFGLRGMSGNRNGVGIWPSEGALASSAPGAKEQREGAGEAGGKGVVAAAQKLWLVQGVARVYEVQAVVGRVGEFCGISSERIADGSQADAGL